MKLRGEGFTLPHVVSCTTQEVVSGVAGKTERTGYWVVGAVAHFPVVAGNDIKIVHLRSAEDVEREAYAILYESMDISWEGEAVFVGEGGTSVMVVRPEEIYENVFDAIEEAACQAGWRSQ